MYSVSSEYLQALAAPVKERRLSGTVGGVAFTEANLLRNTLTITNSCSEGQEVKIGSVYRGELTCTFRNINLTGEWKGQEIIVSEELKTSENVWEAVPLGVFVVAEANHTAGGVYVTAYDYMVKLDETSEITASVGTPYDFLALISEKTGVSLAQSAAEIALLPNGAQSFVLYAENDIETYRDMLHWVAQTCAAFATINRSGEIELRTYKSADSTDDSIPTTMRWKGGSFSDFATRYTGVSVVDMESEDTVYFGAEVDDALTYNLGANPFLQGIELETVMGNILDALGEINYTPFDVARSGAPHYDLGDILAFPGGIAGGCVGCLMSYNYRWRGEYRMEGFGSNPALAKAKSKEDKQIAGLMSRNVVQNAVQFYTFTNAGIYSIEDDYEEIIYIRFGSLKTSIVTFQAEIKLSATIDEADIESVINGIKYIYNAVEVDYKPAETWIEGTHLLHLLYYFAVDGSAINTLSVRMNCVGGVVSIGRADIQAAVSGQGLVASNIWDGWFELEDNIPLISGISTTPAEVVAYTDTPEIALVDEELLEVEDNVPIIDIDTTPSEIIVQDDGAYLNRDRLRDLTWGEVKEYTWTEILDDYGW